VRRINTEFLRLPAFASMSPLETDDTDFTKRSCCSCAARRADHSPDRAVPAASSFELPIGAFCIARRACGSLWVPSNNVCPANHNRCTKAQANMTRGLPAIPRIN